jgi:DNA-binding NarL/FixJ family response regulator
MPQRDRAADSHFSRGVESSTPPDDALAIAELSSERARAMGGAAIARQLNGPLTALLLYMGEIKQHSHQISQAGKDRIYLQQLVENAFQQTERVCAMMKQIAGAPDQPIIVAGRKTRRQTRARDGVRASDVMFSSQSVQKPLTKREREVLNLISEGYSNKQGALRMHISPRTFESHRAQAMRKLGARNTADLVRTALMHPGAI